MKKIYSLIIAGLIASLLPICSQIGINTKQPGYILHIDPKNDTSGTIGTGDDFVIDNTGQVGINTIQPTAKLDVVGNMNIIDGSESTYKAMVSDANGVGTWKRLTYTTKVNGQVPANLASLRNGPSSNAPYYTNTGVSITLPAGQWQIYFYCIYNNNNNLNFTIWWDLCTTKTWATPISGRVLSYCAPTTGLSPTYASYAVRPTSTTTYYILGVIANVSGTPGSYTFTYNSGARLWAIPIY